MIIDINNGANRTRVSGEHCVATGAPSTPISRLSSKAPGSNWMPPEPLADRASPTATATSDAAVPAAGPAPATSNSTSLGGSACILSAMVWLRLTAIT